MRPIVDLPADARRESGDGAHLRLAMREDIARVVALEHEAFSDAWSRASFEHLLDDARALFVVACDDHDVVQGYVVAWYVLDEGEIANLAVSSTARRRGIGSMLLDAAVATARARGAVTVYLEVRDSNQSARSLYASRGFMQVTRRRRYYRDPTEDALVLKLDLEPPPAAPR
ncbi:MAG TPA: ribosomal protein S18-alanine N-acetyltransferase [Gemmatimonadaceae bacterium]|nr:ribosomal protein S18-alanine N-acetyltransferase [Gemmatimonadaceae bacterium]